MMTAHQLKVGRFTITSLHDGTLDLPSETVLGVAPGGPATRIDVNAFLIQGAGRTILVDTGGAAMAPSLGQLLPSLAAAGVTPDEIGLVVLTHLHGDHAGGLTRPDGTAAFRAPLAIPAADAAYWLDPGQEAAAPEARQPSFRSAQAAVAPYRDRIQLLGTAPVAPGLTPVPLPGHTPGHTGYRLEDGGETLLIWGDVIHLPDQQARHPETALIYDSDPAQARTTRAAILARAAAEGFTVAGMHLHTPGFARVVQDGASYRLTPGPYS